MKKLLIITGSVLLIAAFMSCNRVRRSTGHAYMPDMAYSVAFETYAPSEERLSKYGAQYNHQPVEGAIARGDAFPYKYKNDSAGYAQSATVTNPLTSLTAVEMQEAGRLYLVNCGICHGPKLDGQGPLFTSGAYGAAPKNFMDPAVKTMPEGTMFHSVTYGKNMMGSYASQLSTRQRWMIIAYIKDKQKASGGTTAPTGSDSLKVKATGADSIKTTTKK
jgi:mono/diheme cytochrome c family protein